MMDDDMHRVHFEYNHSTGLCLAYCVCGWHMSGTTDSVQLRAHRHLGNPHEGKPNGKE